MDIEKIICDELMAFLPVYIPLKGNCTILFTNRGGIYEIEKTTRTMLNKLSKYYLIDLKASKKYYGNLLGLKNLVPIPFNKESVFIPIKVRKPICKNDGSLGYVNIQYIEKTIKSNDKTLIYLTNGNTIESLSTIETVEKHIKNGYIVKKLYKEKQNIYYINEANFYEKYDQPATKRDIALLINEILKIKETIK